MTDDFRFRWLDMVHQAKLTDSAKVVGAYLFARSGPDRTCFPSMAAIAADCGRSHHTAQRAVAQLQAAGLIDVAPREGPVCRDGRNRVTLYTLQGVPVVEPRATGGVPSVEPLNRQGVPNEVLRGSKLDTQGVPVVEPGIDHRTDHKEQTSKTKKRAPARDTSAINTQCATIYDAYPKHEKRGTAIKAIAKALSKIPYNDLLEAVEAYKVARDGADKQFTPLCATWMNAEQWTDDRAEWTRWKNTGGQTMQPGQPPKGEDPLADQRAEEKRLTAESRAARLLIAEHDHAAIQEAWQAVLAAIADESFRDRMRKAGWEQWKISIAKRLNFERFGVLTRDPDAPKPEVTTLF